MINRDVQRLFDLVRFCRAELLKEGLITEDEYAELLSESGSVDRLQKYDRMQKRIKELESELITLKQNAGLLTQWVYDHTARSSHNEYIEVRRLCDVIRGATKE
jgi:hypothetical protein